MAIADPGADGGAAGYLVDSRTGRKWGPLRDPRCPRWGGLHIDRVRKLLVQGSTNTVCLWHLETGTLRRVLPVPACKSTENCSEGEWDFEELEGWPWIRVLHHSYSTRDELVLLHLDTGTVRHVAKPKGHAHIPYSRHRLHSVYGDAALFNSMEDTEGSIFFLNRNLQVTFDGRFIAVGPTQAVTGSLPNTSYAGSDVLTLRDRRSGARVRVLSTDGDFADGGEIFLSRTGIALRTRDGAKAYALPLAEGESLVGVGAKGRFVATSEGRVFETKTGALRFTYLAPKDGGK